VGAPKIIKGTKEMTAKDYLDPKGYWSDASGNIHRMTGEQEIIATVTGECSEAEWRALYSIGDPKSQPALSKTDYGDGTRGHYIGVETPLYPRWYI
jgi:hypothetical protein